MLVIRDIRKSEFPTPEQFPVICLSDSEFMVNNDAFVSQGMLVYDKSEIYWVTTHPGYAEQRSRISDYPYWITVEELHSTIFG